MIEDRVVFVIRDSIKMVREEVFTTERGVRRDQRIFLIKNSLLRVLRASAVQSSSLAQNPALQLREVFYG